jgi:hypothetical protein
MTFDAMASSAAQARLIAALATAIALPNDATCTDPHDAAPSKCSRPISHTLPFENMTVASAGEGEGEGTDGAGAGGDNHRDFLPARKLST